MFDDASPFGWAVTLLYGVVAWRCRVAGGARPHEAGFWMACALAMLLLGLNKQLDLQTLVIRVLRAASRAGGWYAARRAVEAAGLVLLLGAVALAVGWGWRRRPREGGRLVAVGLGLVALFVLLRAARILHVGGAPAPSAAIVHAALEPAGLLLLLAAAQRAIRRTPAGTS